MSMQISYRSMSMVFFLLFLSLSINCKVTFHLDHPVHENLAPRHQLNNNHQKPVMYHNMRVFDHLGKTNLMHDTTNT